ncbi:MAG TPA: sigma-70 family RNA polymerase sigma factor [Blastocatellia bacterium]|nr:sigma-70 family RNA polymerase sigma factor [Blastocatellia bacterium]
METPAINQSGGGVTDFVSRIMSGDRQAEAELIDCYSRGVRIIIRRAGGDATAVNDLSQETFRIVIEKVRRGEIREPEKLPGFIRSVARNLVIEHFRRAARWQSLAETDVPTHLAPGPLEKLLQKEKAIIVRQVLQKMPNERDIQVLLRYHLAEETKEQICADLGLTSLQFNLVLHRARERYRKLYEQVMRDKQ